MEDTSRSQPAERDTDSEEFDPRGTFMLSEVGGGGGGWQGKHEEGRGKERSQPAERDTVSEEFVASKGNFMLFKHGW